MDLLSLPARRQSGEISAWSLIKSTVVLSIIAVIGYDIFSLGWSHIRAYDAAETAVLAARDQYSSGGSTDSVYQAASNSLEGKFTLDKKDFHCQCAPNSRGSIDITIYGRSSSIVFSRIPGLKKWTYLHVDATRQLVN